MYVLFLIFFINISYLKKIVILSLLVVIGFTITKLIFKGKYQELNILNKFERLVN